MKAKIRAALSVENPVMAEIDRLRRTKGKSNEELRGPSCHSTSARCDKEGTALKRKTAGGSCCTLGRGEEVALPAAPAVRYAFQPFRVSEYKYKVAQSIVELGAG